ncbi:2,4-dienoyl-CoA reductase (NADPH2) [Desulfatibacillum alkenivorans DSM 16219]|jgi:2,4-dienoyl-CoA reductase (NADPH2)|uniref:2,4-dienoyl-CoA reductase (NADPH2) n=1 Tax=Desulfatibacillum alkenivorans DSM 16219 TaxID=1121393 RepID=A0A1M6GIH1_9BACT|nr:FAD-dependent oxidoreductase [Desulfatibacillum alkenivorans]SHJ09726.1 2,4-dienoyl-CoA reductase (NADPH2) [Desulfatibacillum alkenivorans DSM 16219]
MKDPLFEPITINGMDVKNRIYLPAMHLNMATDFIPQDRMIAFYAERAKGGAGMIAVGYSTVNELAGNPGCLGAHSDDFIPGLKRLSGAIRENGARAILQLNHAGRYNHSMLLGGKQPVAPSAAPSRLTRETPRELEFGEIKQTVKDFASAALRGVEAGYNGVEILAGTGYLISEFLSKVTNQRSDEYGGAFENRMRFGLEVARAVKAAVGPDYPLMFRINGNEFMPGGLRRDQLILFARRLVEQGVDGLCVNVGWHEARVPQILAEVPRGAFAYLSRGIKESVDVPVIASHRINDPETARNMLSDSMCDMVAMGRALIADPYLPEKARTGKDGDIVHCIACAQGCFDHVAALAPVECLCNPQAGYEESRCLQPAAAPKKIMVVGGGPAGLSAAAAAARRGHKVSLYEQSGVLGGQLLLAGAPPGREEFIELAADLARQAEIHGASIYLETTVDQPLIEQEAPDEVIIASGATPMLLPIEGIEEADVVQAWDVLAGKARTGRRVVIVGGGAVGIETALFLAEKGTLSPEVLKFLLVHQAEPVEDLYDLATKGTKQVIVLEMEDAVGRDFGKSTRWAMMEDVKTAGIQLRTRTKALAVTENGLKVQTPDGKKDISADTIVLAAGSQCHNPLGAWLEEKGVPFKVVGDAKAIGRAMEAIHQGFLAGAEV